jgi:glycyl-tRNA synthetase beta chain
MVREFTELQGVMGGIYLRAQGAPASVALAVEWHYHPLSIEEGAAPAGRLKGDELAVFCAVSIADKLDTLAGYFGLGLQPTGSSDPYGLRRAAQGAVRVLLDFWPLDTERPRPSLVALAAQALEGHGGAITDPAGARVALLAFLQERLRYVLAARGFAGDEVDAVLGAQEPTALEDVHETLARLEALRKVRSEAHEDFDHLATAFKRAKNILEQSKEPAPSQVQPELFEGDAERALHQAVSALAGRDGGYESRLRALATLREPVDRFFDPQRGVFVMTDKADLRRNRLALLDQMRKLFYRIADISKLGG